MEPRIIDVPVTNDGATVPVHLAPVESSQIEAIGHDPVTKTLVIEFKRRPGDAQGSIYRYANVSGALFADLRDAKSVGTFFYKHIKPAAEKYPYVKISSAKREEAAEVVAASAGLEP